VHDRVKQLYESRINSGTFGDTKWSLFNAICEFYDFHRNVDELDAIQQSFEIDNLVHRDKLTAYKILDGGINACSCKMLFLWRRLLK
jgi:hypothetical protein